MEKENIEQKSIVTGLGLALFLIASTSVLSSWSLVAGFPASRLPNLIVIVAIANNLSLVLLGWVYFQRWRSHASFISVQVLAKEASVGMAVDMSQARQRLASATQKNDCQPSKTLSSSSSVEAQPHNSQERFQAIARVTNDVIWDWDLLTNTVWWSESIQTLFGYCASNLGTDITWWYDCIHAEDRERVISGIHEAIAGGELFWSSEYRYRRADGSYTYVCDRGCILHDDAGNALRMIGGITDVSDKKQAKQALRESQHLLQKIADTIPNLLYIYDLNQNCNVYANRRIEELFGCTQAQLQARSLQFFADVFHPEDFQQLAQYNQRFASVKDGEAIETVYRIKNTRGEWRWFHSWEVVFTRTPEGNPEKILGTAIDISDRKQAEEAQQKTEALYRTLASNFPNGVVSLFDQELRYTLTEGKGLAEVGLSKEVLQGKTVAEIFPPDVCKIKEGAYREALNGNPNVCEIPFRNRFYLMCALPLRNERGEIYAGMSLSQDISELKQAELACQEERNFVSAILDAANALIVVLDQEGRFVRFNRACEQLTGFSFDEVKGQYFWDFLLLPEEVESIKAVVRQLQLGQFPNEHENYWVARDGSCRLLSWFNTVLLNADGSVKYLIGVGIDITDRKRAEDMHLALEREQELSKLRFRFFSMVSHEFRTPLSTILLTAQILESSAREWSEEKRKRNLRRIESAAKTMKQMLDDILIINRAETGKLEFSPAPIDLEQFCTHLVDEMQHSLGSQNILTFLNYRDSKTACVDEKLLRSILINLFLNAAKYSPPGGNIHLVLMDTGEQITFQIGAQGISINQKDQTQLFESFSRGENIESIPGSGLGLTVVKTCVELHGGNIHVSSAVGVGTTFIVTIPFKNFEI